MPDKLVRSFTRVIAVYLLLQFAMFLAYALPYGFAGRYLLPFAASTAGFHALVLFLLHVFKNEFVKIPGGERLESVNLANRITLFRLSTLPTVLFVIVASRDYPIRFWLVALVAIVFCTDFLDGYVSRAGKEVTRVGKLMDSASDYSLLFVITLAYCYYGIIPLWFAALLTARLAGQSCMMLAVFLAKGRVRPNTSLLGKATVASTMVLYGLELLKFATALPGAFYVSVEYLAGAIIAASIVDKAVITLRDFRELPPKGRAARADAAEPGAGKE